MPGTSTKQSPLQNASPAPARERSKCGPSWKSLVSLQARTLLESPSIPGPSIRFVCEARTSKHLTRSKGESNDRQNRPGCACDRGEWPAPGEGKFDADRPPCTRSAATLIEAV